MMGIREYQWYEDHPEVIYDHHPIEQAWSSTDAISSFIFNSAALVAHMRGLHDDECLKLACVKILNYWSSK